MKHVCEGEERVKGLIICGQPDARLRYARRVVPTGELKLYEANFRWV